MDIQRNAEEYRAILERLPTGAYLVDRERRIVLWSDGAERITGYRRHEVVGRSCADGILMHCDDQHDVLCGDACPLHATILDGQSRSADVFLLHKYGQRVPVRVRAVPVRDESGAIVGACECFEERAHAPESQTASLLDPDAMRAGIESELRHFQTTYVPFGVLCIGIDGLGRLRAIHGPNSVIPIFHATGQTLALNLNPGDRVGRWTEARFLASIRACSEVELRASAAILKRLAGLSAVPWWGDRLSIALSVGCTLARPGDTADELIRRAESALQESLENQGVEEPVAAS